jgi:hypothetical protein
VCVCVLGGGGGGGIGGVEGVSGCVYRGDECRLF